MKQSYFLEILLALILVGCFTSKEIEQITVEQLGDKVTPQKFEELQNKAKKIMEEKSIPSDCELRIGFNMIYVDEKVLKFEFQQGEGAVYSYEQENLEFEIQDDLMNRNSIKVLIKRYDFLKQLQQYDQSNNKNYFLKDIKCYIDLQTDSKSYLQEDLELEFQMIVQYEHIHQDLFFKEGRSQGLNLFQISFIAEDSKYRFGLYKDLYHQLDIAMEKSNAVRTNISPMNIGPNMNLQASEINNLSDDEKLQKKGELNLRLNNYSGFVQNGSQIGYFDYFYFSYMDSYWTHPSVMLAIQQTRIKEFSIYSLSLTLITIEFQKLGHYVDYIKQHLKLSHHFQDKKQNYIQYQHLQNIEERKTAGKQAMEQLREITMSELCGFDDQKKQQVIQNLKNFQIATSEDFYRNNCGTCYACVLASALQMDIERLVDGEKILKGFEIVDQAHQNNGNSNNIII